MQAKCGKLQFPGWGAGGAWSIQRRSDRLVLFGILFRDHGNINDRVHSVRDCWNSGLEFLIALSSSSQHDCFSGRQPTAVLAGQRGAELDLLTSGILFLTHRDFYNKRAGGRPFPRTMRTNLRCGYHDPSPIWVAPMFPLPRRLKLLDLHRPAQPSRALPTTRPRRVLRLCHQPSHNRIAMHIPELLRTIFFTPRVEVVIPALPELRLVRALPLCRSLLLQHLQRHCRRRDACFTHQRVRVLGHQDVAQNHELIPPTHNFELVLKAHAGSSCLQQRLPAKAPKVMKCNAPAFW